MLSRMKTVAGPGKLQTTRLRTGAYAPVAIYVALITQVEIVILAVTAV